MMVREGEYVVEGGGELFIRREIWRERSILEEAYPCGQGERGSRERWCAVACCLWLAACCVLGTLTAGPTHRRAGRAHPRGDRPPLERAAGCG